MRNKEQKGDLSVQAIAQAHVVLLGMYLPEQKCPRWLGLPCDRRPYRGRETSVAAIYDLREHRAVSTSQEFFIRPENRNCE
jgi:hypothetical protein